MKKTICFNFATRSRPEKFFACLDNIREMAADKENYRVIAKIDDDDYERHRAYDRLKDYPEVVVITGRSRNKVHAINRGGLGSLEWDILCNHSDDMWFITHGFDEVIRDAFNEHGEDIFVHFPDQVAIDQLCTYSMMDKKYYERFGYIYHPSYVSLWCDNEAQEVAKKLGRYVYVPLKILEHRHPVYGFGEKDPQLRRNESFYHVDRRTFEKRRAMNFGL